MYWFDQQSSFAEFRPLTDQTNNAKLVAFNFPSQYIDSLSNGTYFLRFYDRRFNFCEYQQEVNSNIIKLTVTDPDNFNHGKLLSLELLDNKDLKLKLEKRVFDFVDNDWRTTEMTTIYKKNL